MLEGNIHLHTIRNIQRLYIRPEISGGEVRQVLLLLSRLSPLCLLENGVNFLTLQKLVILGYEMLRFDSSHLQSLIPLYCYKEKSPILFTNRSVKIKGAVVNGEAGKTQDILHER